MLTRRTLLRVGGGAAAAWGSRALATSPLVPVPSPVDFPVPAGACDCHVHIIGDPKRFPMDAGRIYTPPPAPVDRLLHMHSALNLQRVVLVQPSFYGFDNSALLDTMKRLGPRARGIAVVADQVDAVTLDSMGKAGIRGLRINLETAGEFDPAVAEMKLRTAIAQCQPRHWHIQLYTRPSVIGALADSLAKSPVPLVFDHFAGAQAADGLSQPGFDAVLALVRLGKAYVKISAPYRASKMTPDYGDIAPFAAALVTANPDRVLWGSDWPHTDSTRIPGRAATDETPFLPIDDGWILNQLPLWVLDAAARQKILTANPAHLYGF